MKPKYKASRIELASNMSPSSGRGAVSLAQWYSAGLVCGIPWVQFPPTEELTETKVQLIIITTKYIICTGTVSFNCPRYLI